MKSTYIKHIEYYLPENILTNEMLIEQFPDWSVDKIYKKTGIQERRIANDNETASDMAVAAAKKIFENNENIKDEIDFVIFCTQSPDYFLPTTACIIQDRLSISTNAGAIDINQGCSGFVYSLGLSHGLIQSNQARNILLLTAETYTKYINPKDKSVRTLFGDAATATVISSNDNRTNSVHSFSYGTDGSGSDKLIVPHGGARNPIDNTSNYQYSDSSGNVRCPNNLYMNGADVFTFTLKEVKRQIDRVLELAELTYLDIDHFVLHQPNKFMLNQIGGVCNIPKEKLHSNYKFIGNTVSSTIPILLKDLDLERKLNSGDKILICGFGVGYSSAGAIIEW